MRTSNHGGGWWFWHPADCDQSACHSRLLRLGSGGTFSTIHPSTEPKLLVSFVTHDPCLAGTDHGPTDCLTPVPGIHIDRAPAFACLTPAGTLGDRLVDGVCADKVVKPASGPPGGSTDTNTHPSVR